MVENFGESITTEFGAQSYPTWDSKGTYVQYQRVQHKGLTYGAKKTSTGQEPSKDSEYWELLGSLPTKQGEPRDTLIFENDDKTQTINGKGITGASPINVDNGDTVNTVSVDTATKSQLGVVKAGTNINISNGSISVPNATANQKGVVQVGDGLIVDSGTISVPTGNTEQKGLLQVGDGISVNDGIISAKEYELPTASADTLGGVKVGDGLSIADGVLSASSSGNAWETVTCSVSENLQTYLSCNCYKNNCFILAMLIGKRTDIFGYSNLYIRINISNPLIKNNYGGVTAINWNYNQSNVNSCTNITTGTNYFDINFNAGTARPFNNEGATVLLLIPYMEL